LNTIAEAIERDFTRVTIDHRGGALYCEHGGRQYVIAVIDITEQVDVVAKALDVARWIVGGKVEA
jgi:hypothetical protein